MLKPQETIIAYRCPACGKTVVSVTGVFALSGDMIKLKCGCGASELTIKNEDAGKVRISVPCLFCARPHSYVVSRDVILGREAFAFTCKYAGADICFSGAKGAVLKALEESNEEIASLIDDTELAHIDEGNETEEEHLYNDEHVRDMILFVLGDLCEEGKIECDCGMGKGDFLVENDIGTVRISCKKCGCERTFFCRECMETQTLFDAAQIRLVKED